MKLRGRVVVVTGGGNGIGRQVVLEALRRGAKVAAVDIRQESLDETTELAAAGERLATYVCDITDRFAVEALPAQIAEALGPVDVVINVAGIIQPFIPLADLEYEAIGRVVDVNLWGAIHVVKSFLPHLTQRPSAHLATVSSMGAYLPVPGQTIYGATKAAVKLMTEGLYAELVDTMVGVSVIMPGGVGTEISLNSGVEVPGGSAEASNYPVTSPEDAATTILDGIEARRLHIYVGRDAVAMSLLRRAAPKQAIHIIQRQMKKLMG